MGGRVNSEELKVRTKKFAVQVIKFVDGLKQSTSTLVLSKQIVRSSSSIGANYRAACGARSKAEFIAKLQIAREESDETLYWLEILQETSGRDDLNILTEECDELTAIFTAALKTARTN
ncbi:MAG: four helix bundle protein [Ignavibacteriae bacterium]|nr:MAG: four helix bundle protein [Ignavibacteriota bacterium]